MVSETDTVSTMFPMICSLQQRGAGDVVEAYGVVLAGGDEEILLAVEVEAVYLPSVVGEYRADGHPADDPVVELRQRRRHLLLPPPPPPRARRRCPLAYPRRRRRRPRGFRSVVE